MVGRLIDLVAMATHARAGISRMVLGSVATHVLRHVALPVLLLRPIGLAEPFALEPASRKWLA
jgi:nucleotide-binding universal stress UspA family protein